MDSKDPDALEWKNTSEAFQSDEVDKLLQSLERPKLNTKFDMTIVITEFSSEPPELQKVRRTEYLNKIEKVRI